ncbi:retrovirus-related pol polyprotein from transposon TNT 1-94 [Tanacetum coccineum]
MDPEVRFSSLGISKDVEEITISLLLKEALSGRPLFTLREGAHYRFKLAFTVLHNIVSGLTCTNTVWNRGIQEAYQHFLLGYFNIDSDAAPYILCHRKLERAHRLFFLKDVTVVGAGVESKWKVRFLVFLDGLEPYLLKTLEDGPFVHLSNMSTSTNPLPKPHNQSSNAEARLANHNKRLKSIIISCLPNDVMKVVIKCKTTKAMWNDLILAHEGPSDTRDTKIAALRLKFNAFKVLEGDKVNGTFTSLKCLLNDLENNDVIIPQAKVNTTLARLYGK